MIRAGCAALLVSWGCSAKDCSCGGSSDVAKSVVPAEVADEEALAPMTTWLALPAFGDGRYVHQSSADRDAGASVEIPLWAHGNRDFNNFVCRGAKNEAPDARLAFVFDKVECPDTYVQGLVMARFEGSGRLSRLWMTLASIRNKPPDQELVRIYVDDDQLPRIEAPLAEMLQGASEIFAPPFGAGSSRYLAWYYPVVFSKKLVITLDRTGSDDMYFYQADAVLDRVVHERAAAPARLGMRSDARELKVSVGEPLVTEVSLEAGASRTLSMAGPATIVSARVRGESLDGVFLNVVWDGENALDLPLRDFLAAWSPVEEPNLALGAEDGELRLSLPMPFQKTATWKLENRGAATAAFTLTLEQVAGVPNAAWGRLHAQRNESLPGAGPVHPIASVRGRGRLVGVCADLQGHGMKEGRKNGHPFHFLEGDETITIDGEERVRGTGTEDYFNGAFYFEDGAKATPYAQAWNITPHVAGAPNQGRVSACRWHVLGDAIDFERTLQMALEIGPGVSDVLDRFVTVAYFYR